MTQAWVVTGPDREPAKAFTGPGAREQALAWAGSGDLEVAGPVPLEDSAKRFPDCTASQFARAAYELAEGPGHGFAAALGMLEPAQRDALRRELFRLDRDKPLVPLGVPLGVPLEVPQEFMLLWCDDSGLDYKTGDDFAALAAEGRAIGAAFAVIQSVPDGKFCAVLAARP